MDYILFAGPWIKQPGTLLHRIVLHVYKVNGKDVEYAVHDQWCREDTATFGYNDGNYFPVHYDNAMGKAMDKFWERCRNKYHQGTESQLIGINDETVPVVLDPEAEFLQTLATDPNP